MRNRPSLSFSEMLGDLQGGVHPVSTPMLVVEPSSGGLLSISNSIPIMVATDKKITNYNDLQVPI